MKRAGGLAGWGGWAGQAGWLRWVTGLDVCVDWDRWVAKLSYDDKFSAVFDSPREGF